MSVHWSHEQHRAIHARGRNIVVSAGAGSGKTAVLAERIARLAEEEPKLRMDALLVMTFTEAAAEEMRARIARRLRECAAEALQGGDAAKARRFQRLAHRVHDAQISTIHSFCLALLRDHAVEAELAPGFRVLSGEEDAVLLRGAAEQVFDEWGQDAERFRQLSDALTALRLHRQPQALRAVIDLCNVALSQVDPEAWLDQIVSHYDADELWSNPFGEAFAREARMQIAVAHAYMQRGLAELEHLGAPENVMAGAHTICANLQEAMKRLSAPSAGFDPGEIGSLIQWTAARLSSDYDSFKVWRSKAADALKVLRKVLGRGRDDLEKDVRALRPHIEVLAALARDTLRCAKSRRQEQNSLSFSDLEHMTYALLKAKHVRAAVHARYRYVFVDEYQDTSPIQDAIVDAVARPGGLFLVGDVKQSIYGFRMAEPGLFLDRYRRYAAGAGGEAIDLSANYRSRRGIIHFVNYLFRQLFHAEIAGYDYEDGHEMRPEAPYPEEDKAPPPVRVKLFFSAKGSADRGAGDDDAVGDLEDTLEQGDDASDGEDEQVARQKLEIEAMWVADEIARAMERNELVYDRATQAHRPLRYQDIAILLRAGGESLNTVVQVLASRGIPAVARASSGFFRAMEVRWAVCLLAAIDNPLDSLALAAALKSPFVGLADEDLAAARIVRPRGPLWHALRQASEMAEQGGEAEVSGDLQASLKRLAAARERFEHWRSRAHALPPGELMREIARDTEIELYLRAMPRGALRAANLEQFIRLAEAHAPHAGDLYSFLAMVRGMEEADVDLGHAQGGSTDSVSVMTIHGSKGLEFPHVYVLNLGRQFPRNRSSIALNRRLGIGAAVGCVETGTFWRTIPSIAVDAANREAARAEEARVLYVALTRAKERLVLVGHVGRVEELERACDAHDEAGRLTPHAFFSGKSYAAWIVPALMRHPDGAGLRSLVPDLHVAAWDVPGVRFELEVEIDGAKQDLAPGAEAAGEVEQAATRSAPAVRAERFASPEEAARELRSRWKGAAWMYRVVRVEPAAARARVALPSKLTATDIRRWFAERELRRHRQASAILDDPAFLRVGGASPRERGVAFHTFMQRAPLIRYADADEVSRAAQALVEQGLLEERLRLALDPADVLAFFASPLGARVLLADEVYREQPFFYRVDVQAGDTCAPVVVQGVIDCLLRDSGGYVVIDYKTDQVEDAGDLDRFVQAYEPQVATYAAAVKEAVGEEPEVYLYFVQARAARAVRAQALDLRMQEVAQREAHGR
ncbi:UvrD-helicase domain-containing protein [Alicyclobacillus vulcanalis]|uniref:DNA 3'-5' helicase n=1 Tax=Alicyclobacillus vulcanalis TaxID=252246 RepID=A0A1N7L2F8_9BACL|nr:UvrD-helicase domain-containing protein [Alicyclobacillus vulcanalis]SIS68052.1 DNA helicase/exodeoxyribonuclease V, subunit A [Alicyclobacillus vulcanalis]